MDELSSAVVVHDAPSCSPAMLHCPHCGGEVPALRNWTAALVTRVAIARERSLALEDEPSSADDNRGSLSPRFVASARCSDEDRSG